MKHYNYIYSILICFIFFFGLSAQSNGPGNAPGTLGGNNLIPYCATDGTDTISVTAKFENGLLCGLLGKDLLPIQDWESYTLCPCEEQVNQEYFDLSSVCDTVICEIITDPGQTEFLPNTIELNVWSQSYNGGVEDNDNPLLIGETFTPTVNQNVHAIFYAGLPACAVIDSAYILYDHEGTSGTVYNVINTSTGIEIPNLFNDGTVTNTWAWHQGSSNLCTALSTYTRIDGVGYPCGTTRPLRFVSRMDFTPSVDDLNNLSVTSVYGNANIDIYHSIKLNVFYQLPEGCQLTNENGEVVTGEEGKVKVINTQIISQKKPLEVFGTVTVEQPCNDVPFTELFCLAADIPEYGLVINDFIQQIGKADCEGNILGGSYFTLDLIPIEGVEPIIDASCVVPQIKEVQSCVLDDNGNEWQQIIVVTGTEILSTYFLNTATLETSTDIGDFKQCPITVSSFTKNKTCALVQGATITGYEISYIEGGSIVSFFEGMDGETYTDYTEYCCEDCIQYAGCFDPRFVRFSEIVVEGQTIDLQTINAGVLMTNTQVQDYMSENYQGSYTSNTVFGSNFTGCTSIDTWEFLFTNSPQISNITGEVGGNVVVFDFETLGRCSFSDKYVTQRTPICVGGVATYLIDWSNGTKTTELPNNGEDDWCNCDN